MVRWRAYLIPMVRAAGWHLAELPGLVQEFLQEASKAYHTRCPAGKPAIA